uniref:Uncharacterized protein n=1 Tax=Oryza brachyantha TaxID=4533 RepID=J3LA57_ORYBR
RHRRRPDRRRVEGGAQARPHAGVTVLARFSGRRRKLTIESARLFRSRAVGFGVPRGNQMYERKKKHFVSGLN